MSALNEAAKAVLREALDAVDVHPCDIHDDAVRAKGLYGPMADLYAAAIVPPVAAGSVEALERFDLVESQHGTGYMVHWDKVMEEDVDGEWVKHADAIAWGTQQREEGRREMFAEVKEENAILAAKVEKAEAQAAHLEHYFKHHSVQVPPQYTALHAMKDSSADKK